MKMVDYNQFINTPLLDNRMTNMVPQFGMISFSVLYYIVCPF